MTAGAVSAERTGLMQYCVLFCGALKNFSHLICAGRFNNQLEQKAVQLRFGERVGPLDLNRVLGRHNKKRGL